LTGESERIGVSPKRSLKISGSSSGIGEEVGVATVLEDELLLSEHTRVCDESVLSDDVRDECGEVETAGEDAGVSLRCAMLAPVGVRLGRGANFLRPSKFPFAVTDCAGGPGGTNVVGLDCGLGDRNAWRRDVVAGTDDRTGAGKETRAVTGRTRDGRGADCGCVVMNRVAAEWSRFEPEGHVPLTFVAAREPQGFFFCQRFLALPLRFISSKALIKTSRSTSGRSTIDTDTAGRRVHAGAGKVKHPLFTGKGS